MREKGDSSRAITRKKEQPLGKKEKRDQLRPRPRKGGPRPELLNPRKEEKGLSIAFTLLKKKGREKLPKKKENWGFFTHRTKEGKRGRVTFPGFNRAGGRKTTPRRGRD